MDEINQKIADRSNVFYWQTDRAITPQQAGEIWADRHRYFTDDELVARINEVLEDKIANLEPRVDEAQTNLGNVNSVRVATLESGQEIIIRSHPKGILNGYFHAEAAAAQNALDAGLPSYRTLAVHDYSGGDDFAFQVLEKLPGTAIVEWLKAHPDDEPKLLESVGRNLAKVNQITIEGFGPFDNEKAKTGQLRGLHQTLADAVNAGLEFNLDVLQTESIFTADQVVAVRKLFAITNPLLQSGQPILVHNDFADWNLLTDGEKVTGILDWDECVGGDPLSELACWSTFFEPERLEGMLKGYFSVTQKPSNFDNKFQLLRLRYTISKMTLRIRRYTWSPTDEVRQRIEIGKKHLSASLKYFGVN